MTICKNGRWLASSDRLIRSAPDESLKDSSPPTSYDCHQAHMPSELRLLLGSRHKRSAASALTVGYDEELGVLILQELVNLTTFARPKPYPPRRTIRATLQKV